MRHQTLGLQGIEQAHGVSQTNAIHARCTGRVHEAVEKVTGGATGVLGCNRNEGEVCARSFGELMQEFQHLLRCATEAAPLHRRGGKTDVHPIHTALLGCFQIAQVGAAPHRKTGAQAECGYRVDVVDLRPTHGRSADFDFWQPGVRKGAGDAQLFFARKHHARCLLTVAQRGVNQP